MTQSRLHAAVAHATGESLSTINRIGFVEEDVQQGHDPNDQLTVIDCPCCGGALVLAWDRFDKLPEFAECRRCDSIVEYHPWEVYLTRLDSISIAPARSFVPAAA